MGQNQIHFLFLSFLQENGYQLIFLSARAISQASVTRQFLVNLKQVIRHNAFQLFRNRKCTVLLLILANTRTEKHCRMGLLLSLLMVSFLRCFGKVMCFLCNISYKYHDLLILNDLLLILNFCFSPVIRRAPHEFKIACLEVSFMQFLYLELSCPLKYV